MSDPNSFDDSAYFPLERQRDKARPIPDNGVFDAPLVLVPINRKWAQHVSSVLHLLLNYENWSTEQETAIYEVIDLIDCVQGGKGCEKFIPTIEVPVEVPVEVIRERLVFAIEEMLEEGDCFMPCNCPDLAKLIRNNNGTIEIAIKDECGCTKWIPLPNASGIPITERVGDVIDSEGRVIENGQQRQPIAPTPEFELPDVSQDLIRCAKATALGNAVFDAELAMFQAAEEHFSSSGSGIWSDLLNTMQGIVTTLGPVGQLFATVTSVGELVVAIKDEMIQTGLDIFGSLEQRQAYICTLAAIMSARDEIYPEDLSAAIDTMNLINAEITSDYVTPLIRKLSTRKLTDYMLTVMTSADCGCPQIADPISQLPLPDYTWTAVFDFTAEQHDWTIANITGNTFGSYESGVGLRAVVNLHAGDAWYTRIIANSETFDTRTITSIDVTCNFTLGIEGGSWFNHYRWEKFGNGNLSDVLWDKRPPTAGVHTIRWVGFKSLSSIQLDFMAGVNHDTQGNPDGAPPGGDVIVSKIIIRGNGIKPTQLSDAPSEG